MKKYLLFFALVVASVTNCMDQMNDKERQEKFFQTKSIQEIQELINLGININIQDSEGWTKLMRAAHNGKMDIVKLLIANKADLNITNKDGKTALECACYRPTIEYELLQAGAIDSN